MRRLIGRAPVDESGLHPRDQRVGRWYSWFLLVGYTFSFGVLALVVLPATWRSLHMAATRFFAADSRWHQILDSSVFLTLMTGQLAVVGLLALRSRLRRRRATVPTYLTS